MLLYYLFWMFTGFIRHFNIIFGTNLLTQSPVPVSVFFLFLSIVEKENQTEYNWPEISRRLFLDQKNPTEYRRWTRRVSRHPRGWGIRPTPWARPLPRGCLGDPPDLFPTPKPRSGVPPSQASVATKNQSGPCSGTLPEGGTLTGGHSSSRRSP